MSVLTPALELKPAGKLPRELLAPGDPLLAAVRSRLWRCGWSARCWFEESAERWAVMEHLRRKRECLVWVPPSLGDEGRWDAINDQWEDKSVAVFSDGRHDDHKPYVGVCIGLRPGFLGTSLVVRGFAQFGVTAHISPLGVYDMFELPSEFSEPPHCDDE